MTVSEMIDTLNDFGFTDTDTQEKVLKINQAIYDICSRQRWPFLETTLTLTFDGSSAVPSNWPSNFRAALSVINTATGKIIEPELVEVIEKTYPTILDEVGEAFKYYFVGRQMHVVCIPFSSTTLRMRYIKVPTAVTSSSVEADIVVPPEYHEVIVLGALVRLYDQEDDPELSSRFETHYEDALTRMNNELSMRQFDKPQRIHVVEDDDWW